MNAAEDLWLVMFQLVAQQRNVLAVVAVLIHQAHSDSPKAADPPQSDDSRAAVSSRILRSPTAGQQGRFARDGALPVGRLVPAFCVSVLLGSSLNKQQKLA